MASVATGDNKETHFRTAHSIPLFEEAKRLRSSAEYEKQDPSSMILLREHSLRIVLIALKAGGHIPPHDISGPASIQCLEGSVEVQFNERRETLATGNILVLLEGDEHRVDAHDAALILLTIGATHYGRLEE